MRQIRVSLLIATSSLIAIGIVMLYSASAIYAYEKFGDSLFFLKRHLLFLLSGLAATIGVMAIDYEVLKKHSKALIALALFLLVLVLVPGIGYQAGGARRWFHVAGFSLQPSEIAKLCIIIYLADIFSRRGVEIRRFIYGFLPPAIVVGSCVGLVLLEPDLGTAITIALIAFVMFFVAGARMDHIGSMVLVAIPFLYFALFKTPYRRSRIVAFLNPWQDPKGSGFQIIQSFLALGSGGLLGVGLGQSKQKLLYLPASHTDFIFAIIGEELGLIGTLSVVMLFFVFTWQGMRVAFRCEDQFGRLLCLGIVSMIALEAIIHVGVSIGSIPTKGLPLPFISYGGSSLVFHMAAVGIVLNVARGRRLRWGSL
jgi:cell division protein FtsW